jgi:hypothetical protein
MLIDFLLFKKFNLSGKAAKANNKSLKFGTGQKPAAPSQSSTGNNTPVDRNKPFDLKNVRVEGKPQ